MSYGTRPHDLETHELGSMKKLSVSVPSTMCLSLVALRDPAPSSPASMNAKQACHIRPSSHRAPTTM